jgi:hypothetical protein
MPIARISTEADWTPAAATAGEPARARDGGDVRGELLDAYGVRLPSSRSVALVVRAAVPSGCAATCAAADGCPPAGDVACRAAAGLPPGAERAAAAARQGLAGLPGPNLTLAGRYTLALRWSDAILLDLPPFDVLPAAPHALALARLPAEAMAGVALAPAPLVALVDRFGNVAWPDSTTVVAVRAEGVEGNLTLEGLTRARLGRGASAFWNLAASDGAGGGAGGGLRLRFEAAVGAAVLAVVSRRLDVRPGARAHTHRGGGWGGAVARLGPDSRWPDRRIGRFRRLARDDCGGSRAPLLRPARPSNPPPLRPGAARSPNTVRAPRWRAAG